MRSGAEITYETKTNDYGNPQTCVYAECCTSGDSVGPIWGDGEASVKRALAELTAECSCGAGYHFDEDGDDE